MCFPLFPRFLIGVVCVFVSPAWCLAAPPFRITPEDLKLNGNFAKAQILVTAQATEGKCDEHSDDLTRRATYASSSPNVVAVTPSGQVRALGNGTAQIHVTALGTTRTIPVQVAGVVAKPKVDFAAQVLPVISKAGCNAGACHASQYGKGGFKLSVFAFAPDEDYKAVARDNSCRRINLVQPEESLVLLKPTLHVPHEGGHRLKQGSTEYQILRQWIAEGAPRPDSRLPHVSHIQVSPSRRVGPVGFSQQLRVLATLTDGSVQDVTALARFHSMDEGVLEVAADGLVRAVGKGQGVALVQFGEQAQIATVVVPYSAHADLSGWKDQNFIDHIASLKFQELGISPSPLCDDATFLRRAYLDAVGTLPHVEDARAFLNDRSPNKRQQLIDRLLGMGNDPGKNSHNNDYAAYWTLKWSDLIRSNSATIGEQGMWALYNWIKESFRENKPFDQFVRELLTAQGSTYSNGPANYYRIAHNPQELAEATAQIFLGVRLGCAKCHHHPYERLSQADYYGFAAFFARISTKGSQEFGVFGNETVILTRQTGDVRLPRTGQIAPPTPLFSDPVPGESLDRRQALAEWLTSSRNHFFARSIANRYADYLLGRGLVEPVDDIRDTNAASDPALLDALADDFIKSGFNLKHLLHTIMSSRLYQLDSQPTSANRADDRFYSFYHPKRLGAETLLDAIDDATGVPTKFRKVPLGTRAIELPDAQYNNYFLNTFGKPRREAVCECERVSEPNLAQALDTLNGDVLATKITDPRGRLARLLNAKEKSQKIIEELYLASLCRLPAPAEQDACRKMLAEAPSPKAFYEDLLWSLLNSKQFLFVH